MHPSTLGEKITAAVSAIVAIAILGAAVTAQRRRAPQADRLASLESDLRFQIDLAYRADGAAKKAAFGRLEGAVAAWQASHRNDANDARMIAWLEESIRHTLPGADGKLPAGPAFVSEPVDLKPRRPVPSATATAPAPIAAPAASSPPQRAASTAGPPQPAPRPPAAANIVVVPSQSSERRRAVPENPAAAPAPLTTPYAESEHSVAVPATQPAHAASRTPPAPVAVVASTPVLKPVPVVAVNLAELNARIGGYHQGLAELDAAVVADGQPSPAELESLVVRLEALAAQYQFVTLYCDSLTEQERPRVATPQSMMDSVEQVSRYAAKAAEGEDFLAEFEATPDGTLTLAVRLQLVADSVRETVVEGR